MYAKSIADGVRANLVSMIRTKNTHSLYFIFISSEWNFRLFFFVFFFNQEKVEQKRGASPGNGTRSGSIHVKCFKRIERNARTVRLKLIRWKDTPREIIVSTGIKTLERIRIGAKLMGGDLKEPTTPLWFYIYYPLYDINSELSPLGKLTYVHFTLARYYLMLARGVAKWLLK